MTRLLNESDVIAAIERATPPSMHRILSDQIRALPDADQWQGIESALRDGTVIDAWHLQGGRETVFWGLPHHDCGEATQYCDSDWHQSNPGWICANFNMFSGPFTHWQPLPAPPKGE